MQLRGADRCNPSDALACAETAFVVMDLVKSRKKAKTHTRIERASPRPGVQCTSLHTKSRSRGLQVAENKLLFSKIQQVRSGRINLHTPRTSSKLPGTGDVLENRLRWGSPALFAALPRRTASRSPAHHVPQQRTHTAHSSRARSQVRWVRQHL